MDSSFRQSMTSTVTVIVTADGSEKMALNSYIYQHGNGIYYFRRAIPRKIRDKFSTKPDIRISLQTRDPKMALALSRKYAVQCDELFSLTEEEMDFFKKPSVKDLVGKLDFTVDVSPTGTMSFKFSDVKPGDEPLTQSLMEQAAVLVPKTVPVVVQAPPVEQPKKHKIGTVMNDFLTKSVESTKWSSNNKFYYQTRLLAWGLLLDNVYIDELSEERFVEASKKVAYIPQRQNHKMFADKSPADMAKIMQEREAEGEDISDKCISVETYNKYVTCLITFLDWAQRNGYVTKNVAESGKKKSNELARNKRDNFTHEQVQIILKNPLFQRPDYRKEFEFFVPLIAMYSGARQSEIAQLCTDDIVQEDGIWGMQIRDDEDDDVSAKNLHSIRFVPFHDVILKAGLLDYHKGRKEANFKKLFFDEERDYGDAVNKFFNRTFLNQYNDHASFKNRKKLCFHSFRHTVMTELTNKMTEAQGIDMVHIEFTLGYSAKNSTAQRTYLKKISAANKLKVVSLLDFGVDVPHYKTSEKPLENRLETIKQRALTKKAKNKE